MEEREGQEGRREKKKGELKMSVLLHLFLYLLLQDISSDRPSMDMTPFLVLFHV